MLDVPGIAHIGCRKDVTLPKKTASTSKNGRLIYEADKAPIKLADSALKAKNRPQLGATLGAQKPVESLEPIPWTQPERTLLNPDIMNSNTGSLKRLCKVRRIAPAGSPPPFSGEYRVAGRGTTLHSKYKELI